MTREEIIALIEENVPSNVTREISALKMREVLLALVDYPTDSGGAVATKVYSYTLKAADFEGVAADASTFTTNTLFSVGANEILIAARLYINTPFVITEGIQASVQIQYGETESNPIYPITANLNPDALAGGSLDSQPSGFKGYDGVYAELWGGFRFALSTDTETPFFAKLDIGEATFADIEEYGEVQIYIITQPLS